MSDYKKLVSKCIECSACSNACIFFKVSNNKINDPRYKIQLIEKLEKGRDIEDKELDALYLCTMCGACNEVCPENIPISDIIKYGRGLISERGHEPEKTSLIVNNIIEEKNPMGLENLERQNWVTDDLEISDESNIGYMAGCWISFKYPDIAENTIKILNKGGIRPQLIEDEKCCGLFVTDNGHIDKLKKYVKNYIHQIEEMGIHTLVLSCPACYGQMKKIYPKIYREPKFEVIMSMEIYQELINQDKLQLSKGKGKVTLKDACPLKNMHGLPREIIGKTGLEVKEMFHDESICCGAPAGVKPNYPEISNDIGRMVLDKSNEISNEMITLCPYCLHHYKELIKEDKIDLKISDITNKLIQQIK